MDLRNRKIIVTGGSGFLGKHLVARLRQQGCTDVFVPRRREYNLTREADVERLLQEHCPEVVFHLAAVVGGIGANRANPGSFFYENLVMGALLIEGCRRHEVDKFVQVGTTCSYPKFTPVPFQEDDLWAGYPEETNAPYGLAKRVLFVQLKAYREQYGFNSVCLLLANLYGPSDNFDPATSHVIPALVRKCVEARARNERAIRAWGTGQPTREFLYVEDAARAIQLAAERLDSPDPVNIGSGEEISIADLTQLIALKTGFEGDILFDPNQPDGQPRRSLDITRARELLGFTPTTSLPDGLDRTIDWYVSTQQKASGRARTAKAG